MLLEGFYFLAKILVLYIRGIYYKDPVVINQPFAKINHPTILVSNHPNTLLDPIFAAATVSEQVNFLANYSLFKTRFGNWFFNTFYCIPVQRPEDVADGKTDNEASLAKSHTFLANGGNLYIAAEAYSIRTIGLRPLKTGAARIGLNTELEHNWNAKIQILPIGLNYSESDRFRSNLVIHIGKPFDLRQWQYDFNRDPRETVVAVTNHLADQMKTLLLHDDDADTTKLLEHIRIYQNYVFPTDPKREYLRARKLLFELQAKSASELEMLKKIVFDFESASTTHKVKSMHIAQALHDEQKPIRLSKLVWSLPITVFGFLTNVIPFLICHSIERFFNKSLVYRATYRLLPGLIFFPLMYLFWMWGVSWATDSVLLTLGSIFLYRRAGIFAWHQIQDWRRYFRFKKIRRKYSPLVLHLSALLKELKEHNM